MSDEDSPPPAAVAGPSVPTFLPSVTLDLLSNMTMKQKSFIIGLRTIDPEIQGQALREIIADEFLPGILFDPEIGRLGGVWHGLRTWLASRGVILPQHSSRRIILTLASGIYEDAEDRTIAMELAQRYVTNQKRGAANPDTEQETHDSPEPSTNIQVTTPNRVAHNIAMRFKDTESKFSGDIGECWQEYVDEYRQVRADYNLTPAQKLQFIHNILSKDAQRFFVDRVKNYATNFEHAVELVDIEYNSAVRQSRVKNYLNSLRVSDFINSDTDAAKALSKVYKAILKMSRQVPLPHRGDEHRVEFLRHALIGQSWARDPLARVATNALTFQQLYGELESAVQLDKESKLASTQERARIRSVDNDVVTPIQIHFAGQGRYRHGNTSNRGKPRATFDPLSLMGCFNCDDPGHRANKCPKPPDYARAAARKIEYLKKKRTPNAVHIVLAFFCSQMDVRNEPEPADNDLDENDVDIFNNIIDTETPAIHVSHVVETDQSNESDDNQIVDIFAVGISPPKYEGCDFIGGCIDSGAQRTVIGTKQAAAYCRLAGVQLTEHQSDSLHFKFGNNTHRGHGSLTVRLPVNSDHYIDVRAHIVNVDIPLLIGLDVLTSLRATIDFADDIVSAKDDSWSIKLRRKLGHLYIVWDDEICFMDTEVRRLHRHFHHPSDAKLMALIERANPDDATTETKTAVAKVRNACNVCQRNAREPSRFRFSLPEDECVFNRIVSMDIMSLDGRHVLHCVDRDTKFGAAAFLSRITAKEIWQTYNNIWAAAYVGHPDVIAADQGTQFTSDEFVALCASSGIRIQPSGVESHNALGSGERYHSYLKQVYTKVCDSQPDVDRKHALRLSVKAFNDTAGPKGLVPTLLVFGILPRMPVNPRDLPEQRVRFKIMKDARDEMTKLTALTRIQRALNCYVPMATDLDIRISDRVLIYRERPKRWEGPYSVIDVRGKMVVTDVDGKHRHFSIDKVRPYQEDTQDAEQQHDHTSPQDMVTPDTTTPPRLTSLNADTPPHDATDPSPSPTNNDPREPATYPIDTEHDLNPIDNSAPTPHDNPSPSLTANHERPNTAQAQAITNWSDDDDEDSNDNDVNNELVTTGALLDDAMTADHNSENNIFVVKIIPPSDPRAKQADFIQAKRKEAEGLMKRKIWKVVKRRDVPLDANVIGARFVLSIKNYQTPNEAAKARYVAQGYNDKEKQFIVHDVNIMRPTSSRLILSTAAVKQFRLFSHDVTQAYCQSKMRLTRSVYLQPKKGDLEIFGLQNDELLELLLPLYGLCDAGDYWGITLDIHITDDLKMKPIKSDSAVYTWTQNGKISGLTGTYVDDCLNAGDEAFQAHTELTLKHFESKPRTWDDFDFYGTQVNTTVDNVLTLSQPYYTRHLKATALDADFSTFRRDRALLTWLTHTRPDLSCIASRAAQVSEKTFSTAKIKELNKGVRLAKSKSNTMLKYRKLHEDSIHIRVYSDAAFAINDDLSSQLGYIILLVDK